MTVRAFKTKVFARFAASEGIGDRDLRDALLSAEKGGPMASLGGDVFKLRVARRGRGKSGGYRVIVIYRRADRAFFVYGYAKSDIADVSVRDSRYFKSLARVMLTMTEKDLHAAMSNGTLTEIDCRA